MPKSSIGKPDVLDFGILFLGYSQKVQISFACLPNSTKANRYELNISF